jgi:hypothetical protein
MLGLVLDLFWTCFGLVLDLFWTCLGLVLDLFWTFLDCYGLSDFSELLGLFRTFQDILGNKLDFNQYFFAPPPGPPPPSITSKSGPILSLLQR